MKTCIYCGAELPDTANLCPNCGKAQTEAGKETMPRPWRRKLLTGLAVLLALSLCALGVRLYHAPKEYVTDGAEILYSDAGGKYKIFLTWTGGAGTISKGVAERTVQIAEGDRTGMPAQLLVYDISRDMNLTEEFLARVENARVEARPENGASPMEVYEPVSTPDFPGRLFVADVQYTADCGTNDIVWTLKMKNGDRIQLQQRLNVEKLKTAEYTADTWPMDSIEDLQALFRHIEETESPDTVVTVYLPAVTYAGGLHFAERCYKLVGTSVNGQQTTFTGGFTVSLRRPQVAEFENICFSGGGRGTGISASEGVLLLDCRVTGWEIGAEAREGAWIAAFGTAFEGNGIGLQFNSTTSSMTYPAYELDSFLNNGVGVSLLRVPGTEELRFPECVFSGNVTDIDNPAGRPVNTRDAVFEP